MPKHYFSNYLLAVSQNIPFQNICCVCLQEVGCCLCFKFRSKALWSIHPWALLQGSYWDTQLLKMLFLFILLLLRMEHLCCKSRGDEKEHYHFTEVSWHRYNMISEPHSLSNGLKTNNITASEKAQIGVLHTHELLHVVLFHSFIWLNHSFRIKWWDKENLVQMYLV